MATDLEARALIQSLLAAIATKPDLRFNPSGTPSDFSVLVRNDQPENSGGSQYQIEVITMATEGAMLARRPGACGIQSVELDDILSRSESQPGDPFTGSLWFKASTSELKQYDGSSCKLLILVEPTVLTVLTVRTEPQERQVLQEIQAPQDNKVQQENKVPQDLPE